MTQLLVAGIAPVPGAVTWPASGQVPGSAAAWPGEVGGDGDGCSSFPGARADRSAAFGVALPVPGQRSLDGPGVRAHAEVRLDRPGQGSWPQCGVGGQRRVRGALTRHSA